MSTGVAPLRWPGFPRHVHVVDSRECWTRSAPIDQLLDCAARSLSDKLNAPIGQIADLAPESEPLGLLLRRRSKVHALHAARYDDTCPRKRFRHGCSRGFVANLRVTR